MALHQPWARCLEGDSIPTKIGSGRVESGRDRDAFLSPPSGFSEIGMNRVCSTLTLRLIKKDFCARLSKFFVPDKLCSSHKFGSNDEKLDCSDFPKKYLTNSNNLAYHQAVLVLHSLGNNTTTLTQLSPANWNQNYFYIWKCHVTI